MSRIAKAARRRDSERKMDTPVVVYFSAAFIGILAYVVARVILDGKPHPIHWAAMLVGGVLGYFLGWLWFRWRGDII